MAIKEVIIQVVKRKKTGDSITTNLRDKSNKVEKLTTKLTDDLLELFSSSSLQHGEFGVDGDITVLPVFEQTINKYFDSHLACSDFAGFSKIIAKQYQSAIEKVPSAKGGYLVFYRYTYLKDEWLGLTILSRLEGADVSDGNNELVESKVLDLTRLHLGAAINLTDWKQGLSTRYIRFKIGTAKEIREYFEAFIGCQRDKEAAKNETRNLKKAIKSHAERIGDDSGAIQARVEVALTTIKATPKGKPVLLETIANAVFPSDPKSFIKTATQEFYVNEEVLIHNTELSQYKRIKGGNKNITVSFERTMFGKSVLFEPAPENAGEDEFDKLIILEIPYGLKQELIEEQKAREKDSE
jgi:nucleoid-associated protein